MNIFHHIQTKLIRIFSEGNAKKHAKSLSPLQSKLLFANKILIFVQILGYRVVNGVVFVTNCILRLVIILC